MKYIRHASLLFATSVLFATPVVAETVLHNINGYTSGSDGLTKFSVLVFGNDGRVIATGDDDLTSKFREADRIDGLGHSVLPGLTDAHGHVAGLGLLRSNLDLRGSPSIDDAVTRIAAYAASRPGKRWIVGRGWNQVIWPTNAFPTAADVDAVVSDKPVWLQRIDGHAGWANSAALAIAGIDDSTVNPSGGKIVRDANGRATGILIDQAMKLISKHVPTANKADTRHAIVAAMQVLLSEGVTSVHDAGIDLATAETYLSLADDGQLPIRIYAMIGGAGHALDALQKPIVNYGDDRLDIASVKLYADGALGSHGAAMMEPYSDDVENRGLPFWTQTELDRQVEKAVSMGFQVAIHAIGDYGNRQALNAIEAAQRSRSSALRNRIEHAQIIELSDMSRFSHLGVIASVQAIHATSDMNMAEDRVGPERIKGGYAWRRLLEAGVVLANGSDFPVELSNPFHGLHAAVTRKNRDDEPDAGWYTDQALTRAEALHSFTLAAAFAAHNEDRMGSLETGKWADFIVIDRDYFTIPDSEIDDIRVLQTWVGGKLMYERGETE